MTDNISPCRLIWDDNFTDACSPHLFPNDKFLNSSKLKELADDAFKFDENDRKFSKQVENTAGNGEITHYEQFLLFPECFQKTCTADTTKQELIWERNNQPIPKFHELRNKSFENIVAKGENAGNQHFLLFPQCFLTLYQRSTHLKHI